MNSPTLTGGSPWLASLSLWSARLENTCSTKDAAKARRMRGSASVRRALSAAPALAQRRRSVSIAGVGTRIPSTLNSLRAAWIRRNPSGAEHREDHVETPLQKFALPVLESASAKWELLRYPRADPLPAVLPLLLVVFAVAGQYLSYETSEEERRKRKGQPVFAQHFSSKKMVAATAFQDGSIWPVSCIFPGLQI